MSRASGGGLAGSCVWRRYQRQPVSVLEVVRAMTGQERSSKLGWAYAGLSPLWARQVVRLIEPLGQGPAVCATAASGRQQQRSSAERHRAAIHASAGIRGWSFG